MLKIGITGGIGSGKTTVCNFFRILGVPIYDADSRAKLIMNNDFHLKSEIINTFGEDSYNSDGLNRIYLANTVFKDSEKVKILNSIVHPAVGEDFEKFCKLHSSKKYILKEAALMFESGAYKSLDKIITISTPLETRISRVLKRDPQRTEEQILQIIDKQLPEKEKEKRADFCITNDNSSLLIPQILELHSEIIALAIQ